MVELAFSVDAVQAEPYAASPTLVFKLRLVNGTPDVGVQNVLLNCQLRIAATRRRYSAREQDALSELFGAPNRWGETLRSLLWTHVNIAVPAFTDACVVDLPVGCSFDFNIATTKYFGGLEQGDIPVELLFSGTIFYRDEAGALQMEQIAWSKETAFRVPAQIWRDMMDIYYPNSVWLRIDRAAFDELYAFKRARGLTNWDAALAALLERQKAESAP